jgi:hypothetical protein
MATAFYVDPIPAGVTPERIDQGVDYAGSGNLLALGDGVVTQVNPGGWGKYGNYIAYKLTTGPLAGREVYYAEGVTPHVKVGQKLSAGQIVASIIPKWASGIEVGYGSGKMNTSYAQALGGGYTEGHSTAAGQAFSDLVKQLGGPAGVPQAGSVTGTAAGLVPAGGVPTIRAATPAELKAQSAGPLDISGGSGQGGIDLNPADAVTKAINAIFNSIVSHAKYAALALVLIVGGFVLLGKGVSRATHAGASS